LDEIFRISFERYYPNVKKKPAALGKRYPNQALPGASQPVQIPKTSRAKIFPSRESSRRSDKKWQDKLRKGQVECDDEKAGQALF
jgi:hypothetical protein